MKGPHPTRLALAGLLVLAACSSGGDGDSDAAGDAGSDAAGVVDDGTASEEASGEGFHSIAFTRFDGGEGTFAEYAGEPTVVNFFASWCAPCVREMPEFEQVHQELGDDVQFVGVNVQDQTDQGLELAEETGVTFDLVRDPDGAILTEVGGIAMPTTAFVDAEGNVVEATSRTFDAEQLTAAIEENLL